MTNSRRVSDCTTEVSQLDLLQASLDHINQGFSVFDADLRLVAANSILFEMLDFPDRLQARGTHLSEFLRVNAERGEYGDGDIEAQISRRVERAARFEPHAFERKRPSGQIISIRGGPLPNGGFVTTYTDVTRERQHQQQLERTVQERTRALQQSEDWLRLVTDNIPALVCYIAPGPVYRFANAPYAVWFDHTPASIMGKSVETVVGTDLFARMGPIIEKALSGQVVNFEYARTNRKGEHITMRSTLVPDRTADGRCLGCFVLSIDASEQKESENRLLQSQRMEAVGQLTGGLSHDFNNLLSIIIGNGLSLNRKAAQGPLAHDEVERYTRPILQAANRGADLTKRLLAFARGGSQEHQPTQLCRALQHAQQLVEGSLPKAIKVQFNLPADPLMAAVDPTLFDNAVVNLALNTRDAMPGGGALTVTLSAVNLSGETAKVLNLPVGDYAELEVLDEGAGLSDGALKQAFEPFFTTKTFGNSSGLGLSMVYGFAKQAGGTVRISNREDRSGARVQILLPILAKTTDQPLPRPTGTTARRVGHGELIIIVEDEPDLAAILTEQVSALGFSAILAEDGRDALELVRTLPEVRGLLSDIIMPEGLNGIELANQIANEKSGIGIILMTGYNTETPVEIPRDLRILRKPFDEATLSSALLEILS
ncbi:PAS-domain containing protein [Pseudovibrio sp. SPO723]|uniref:PAS-domain containing protein n=1 Tax=Nesiotobacter zosterae TaxID=392721 RepID=UPI0029C9C585|nr:PAS-domain containing protein [Pseudovibrio sp. SPO723]